MAPISPFYGGLLALLTVYLSFRVSVARRTAKVSIGDAGDKDLVKAIRVHSNSVEYIPLGIVLLVLLELQETLPWQMHLAGGALVLGRVLHAYGLGSNPQVVPARLMGMYLTHGAIALMAIGNIALPFL
jgi:uncharacterized membrane protein YecN with MAPEG domain